MLASGSRDTAVIVWDMITESGLFRLKGHKDNITSVRFVEAAGGDAQDYVSTHAQHACTSPIFSPDACV